MPKTFFSLADWADRLYWLWLIIATPFLLFPSAERVPILLLVPGVWLITKIAGHEPLQKTPLNGSLLVMSLMMLVSLYATFDIAFSLDKIAGLLLGFVVYFAITRWLDCPRRLSWMIVFYLLAGGVFSMIALLGTNWATNKVPLMQPLINQLPRVINGIPGALEGFHFNAVAGTLVLFIPLQTILFLDTLRETWSEKRGSLFGLSSRWILFLQLVLLCLTLGVLILTQSRGGWLGFGIGCLALLAWHEVYTRKLLLIVSLVSIATVIAIGPRTVSNFIFFQTAKDVEVNLEGRQEVWSRAIYGIQDFPFTGMGMNTFRKVMPVLYPAFLVEPDFDIAHAHNHLLQAALDLGLPGLIAYLAIWFGVASMIVTVLKRAKLRWYRTIAGGLGGGLLAHFIFSVTDAIPLGAKVGVVFWVVLAFVTALFLLVSKESSSQSGMNPRFIEGENSATPAMSADHNFSPQSRIERGEEDNKHSANSISLRLILSSTPKRVTSGEHFGVNQNGNRSNMEIG